MTPGVNHTERSGLRQVTALAAAVLVGYLSTSIAYRCLLADIVLEITGSGGGGGSIELVVVASTVFLVIGLLANATFIIVSRGPRAFVSLFRRGHRGR